MSVKTFWLILLKIIGITLALKGANVLIQSLSTLAILSSGTISLEIFWTVLYILFIVVIYFFILRLFLIKTSWLVEKLQLEKGFADERIEISVHLSSLLSVAVIVVGGVMLVDSLPQLCNQTFVYLQLESLFPSSHSLGLVFLYGIKSALGYLLIKKNQTIVAYIVKKGSLNDSSPTQIDE